MPPLSIRLKRTATAAIAATSLAIGAAAHAEYRLSVFEDARAHDALSRQDTAAARSVFSARSSLPLDYADLNNLCVLRIMERNAADAEGLCRNAYLKVNEKSMRLRGKRRTRAVILANLAVAQLLDGKTAAAQTSLAKAKAMDDGNPNVGHNLEAMARNLLAASR